MYSQIIKCNLMFLNKFSIKCKTRMHSSRMRTANFGGYQCRAPCLEGGEYPPPARCHIWEVSTRGWTTGGVSTHPLPGALPEYSPLPPPAVNRHTPMKTLLSVKTRRKSSSLVKPRCISEAECKIALRTVMVSLTTEASYLKL